MSDPWNKPAQVNTYNKNLYSYDNVYYQLYNYHDDDDHDDDDHDVNDYYHTAKCATTSLVTFHYSVKVM